MKTQIFSLLIIGLFFFVSCQNELMDDEFSMIEKSCSVEMGTFVTKEFTSPNLAGNLLGDPSTRKVNVYLPKSYYACPEKRFPVIYFLHGVPAWESMLNEFVPFEIFKQVANLQQSVDFPSEGFLNWINDLIENKGMAEVILVFPDSRTLFEVPTYTNSIVQGNYEDYIVNDLVEFVDSNFRTITHFNWRAISGHCAGAYGALKLAMQNPHKFRYVAGLSPAHFPEPTVLGMASFLIPEDQMWASMGAPDGPIPYNPLQPFKFANNSMYALAQAWLPNTSKPYLCDVPFAYVNGQPVLDTELMQQWNSNSLLSLTQDNFQGLKALKSIYFDCGNQDELNMFPPNQMLHEQLSEMGIKHQFEVYEGTHISNLYERLDKVFIVLSNAFPNGRSNY